MSDIKIHLSQFSPLIFDFSFNFLKFLFKFHFGGLEGQEEVSKIAMLGKNKHGLRLNGLLILILNC